MTNEIKTGMVAVINGQPFLKISAIEWNYQSLSGSDRIACKGKPGGISEVFESAEVYFARKLYEGALDSGGGEIEALHEIVRSACEYDH